MVSSVSLSTVLVEYRVYTAIECAKSTRVSWCTVFKLSASGVHMATSYKEDDAVIRAPH